MRRILSILAILGTAFGSGPAWAEEASAVVRSETRRSVAEYLFLGAQLGFRQRAVVYAEDGAPGPGGRGELRFYLNGRGTSGPQGPLGAYLGLGVIGRTPRTSTADLGDPLLDPYDDFAAAQNLRILSGHLEYQHHPEDGPADFAVRAGRLANLDGRAMLLLFDGLSAQAAFGEHFSVSAFGGRRAALDRGFADQREDLPAQLVLGGALTWRGEALAVELGHQLEELQQSRLSVAFAPSPELSFGLTAQAIYGGPSVPGASALATILRFDADLSDQSHLTSGYLVLEAQLGADPRSYGRGGRAPTLAELQAVRSVPIGQAQLDRLFFGPEPGHGYAELAVTRWLLPYLGLSAGAFARLPWSSEDLSSLRPRILEAWFGPELALAAGPRLALEARLALEDPGEPGRIFSGQGDGERSQRSLRAYAELPFRLSDDVVLALRPEGELAVWSTEGPTSESSGQLSYAAGLLATLGWDAGFRLAARYSLAHLPPLVAEQVELLHDLELILEGSY